MHIKASELDRPLLRGSTRATVTVALAAAAAVIATLITAATPLLAHNVFLLPLFAVLLSALFGGTAAGLAASIVSTAGAAYAIMPPLGSLAPRSPSTSAASRSALRPPARRPVQRGRPPRPEIPQRP